jgi:plastocyanin
MKALTVGVWVVTVVFMLGAVPTHSAHQPIRMDVLWPYYLPAVATVSADAPIEWMNPTSLAHTVRHDGCRASSVCAFDSGPVHPEGRFTIPGLPPGRYPYHCALHPVMRGTLVVKAPLTQLSSR